MSHNSIDKKRFKTLTWMGAGLFAFAGVSQARVQLFDRDEILTRATKTDRFIVSRIEAAKRGGIFDRDGKPLAQDEDTRFLTVCFDKTPRSPAFFLDLAAATGIPASEFATMADSKAPVDWKKPIGTAQASAVQDVKQKWRADGVGLSRSGRRSYPLGEAAAGFLGAMRDKTPLSGLELGENELLAGKDGKKVGIVDREGNYLPMRLDKETIKRKDGSTITLTIDSELQQAAAEAVRQSVEANKADQGVAIVMSPQTGEILAMANWPSFDPNRAIEPNTKGRTPEFNGAYMAALEPGSTFKVLTLAKALDKGVVQPDETFYCKGTMTVGKRTIGCDREHGAHGAVSTEQAIARSCNLAAANWALRIGRDDFIQYMQQLGLMDRPDLGLPQESRGLYNFQEYAKTLQVANNGFGQSMNYTPLALASAFCALGNDGKRVFPKLISKIDDEETPTKVGSQVVSADSAHMVLHMMRSVFESDRGTGKSLRIAGYELGGKTGTAQKTNLQSGTMKGGGHVSNFVAFVPAEQPKAMILVMIDNPKAGQYYGATVAGPVFRSVCQAVIRKMHVPRSDGRDSDLDAMQGETSQPKVAAPKIQVETKRISSPAMRSPKAVSVEQKPEPRAPKSTPVAPKSKPTQKTSLLSPKRERAARAASSSPEPKITVSTKRAASVPKQAPKSSSVKRVAKKAPVEPPAEIQTRRSSAIKLEGGLAPRIGRTSPATREQAKPTSARREQSKVTPKRVNRDR